MARAEQRAAERARRREELRDAAIALVRRDGPIVSMDQIAAECGITKPIIYRHFGDREGLILEMAMRFVDELIDVLQPLSANQGPVRALLVGAIDAYLALIERDTNLYRFLSDQVGAHRDLLARLIAEQIAMVIEQRLVQADLPTDGARPWAYGLVGMVHFAGDWWSEDKAITRAELVDRLSLLLWDGLASLDLDGRTARHDHPRQHQHHQPHQEPT